MTILDIVIEGKDEASGAFKSVDSSLGKLAGTAGKAATVGLGLAAAGVAAVGAAAIGAGVAALNLSTDINNATNNIATKMGISQDAAAGFEGVMKDIYANNFGESFDDISDSIVLVSQSLGEMSAAELQGVTEDAFALRDAFEVDVAQSVTGAKALIEAFGLTGEQAMDFVASGMQNGLNASDDFLESIGEYSNLFSEAGFSADEMYNIMATGAQAGILGTDKIADAVKEMGIKLNEGGDDTKAAFDTIGLSFDDIAASVADGSADWGDYFNDIVGGLNDIEDPMARSQAQVGIFGTMAEDLGVSFTEGLSTAGTALDDMSQATENLNAQYDNFPAMFAGFKRNALLALEPLGDILLEIGNLILPIVQRGFEWFSTNVGPIIARVVDVLRGLIASVQDSGSAVDGLIGFVKNLLLQFGLTESTIDTVINIVRTLADILKNYLGNSINNLKLLVSGFRAAFEGDFATLGNNVVSIFKNTLNMLVNALSSLWSMLQPVLANMWTNFSGWFQRQDWQKIGNDVVTAIINGLKTFVATVGPLLVSWGDAFLKWFNGIDWAKIGYDIVKFIIGALKFFVTEIIPTLAGWASAFFNWVGEQDWPAIGLSIINGLITGLTNASDALYNALKSLAQGMWNAIKEEILYGSPAKLFIPLGESIPQGLAKGVANAAQDPIDAMQELADKMTSEMISMVQSIIALVGPMLAALRLLSTFDIDSAKLIKTLNSFGDLIFHLGRIFAVAGWKLVIENRDMAKKMGEAMGPVVNAVVQAIEAFQLLGKAVFPTDLVGKITTLVDHIAYVAKQFAELAKGMTEELSNEMQNFNAAAASVMGLIGITIEAMTTLAAVDFGPIVQGMRLSEQIETFKRIVKTTMLSFLDAAMLLDKEMSEQVGAFADAAVKVFGLVEIALSAIKLLSDIDFGPIIGGLHLAGQIKIFRNIVRTVVREFADAAGEMTSELSEAIVGFIGAAAAVFALVEDAIIAVSLLSETDFKEIVDGLHLANQIRQFRGIIEIIVTEFSRAASKLDSELMTAVSEFAAAAGNVVAVIGPAVAAIASIGDFVKIDEIEARLDEFFSDFLQMVVKVGRAIRYIGLALGFEDPDMQAALTSFTDGVNAIVGVIQPAVDALKSMTEYVKIGDLQDRLNEFFTDFLLMSVKVGRAIRYIGLALGLDNPDLQAALVSFAGGISSIIGVIEPATAALTNLVEYVKIEDLQAKLDSFFTDFAGMAITLVTKLNEIAALVTEDDVTVAANFASSVNAIFNSVIDSFGSLNDLVNTNIPGGLQQILNDAIDILRASIPAAALAGYDFGMAWISGIREALGTLSLGVGNGGGQSLSFAGAAAGAGGAGGLTTNLNVGGLTFNTTISNQMDEDEFHFRVIETIRSLV